MTWYGANWPERLGTSPARMIAVLEAAGGKLINRDRHPHPVQTIVDVVRRQRQTFRGTPTIPATTR